MRRLELALTLMVPILALCSIPLGIIFGMMKSGRPISATIAFVCFLGVGGFIWYRWIYKYLKRVYRRPDERGATRKNEQ